MKKMTLLILMMLCVLIMTGCGQTTQTLGITIPAGSTGEFVYSEEEISPTGNRVTISAGEGLTEAEVILKTIEVKEETAYLPEHVTSDASVTMDVEVEGVKVRIR